MLRHPQVVNAAITLTELSRLDLTTMLCLQAEAAAAQRAFEHAHAMLEGQLNQLSSAINSQVGQGTMHCAL